MSQLEPLRVPCNKGCLRLLGRCGYKHRRRQNRRVLHRQSGEVASVTGHQRQVCSPSTLQKRRVVHVSQPFCVSRRLDAPRSRPNGIEHQLHLASRQLEPGTEQHLGVFQQDAVVHHRLNVATPEPLDDAPRWTKGVKKPATKTFVSKTARFILTAVELSGRRQFLG